MAKHSSKEKVLDMYASVISKEKAKLKKSKKKQKSEEMDADSDSDADTDMSIALIESVTEDCSMEDDRDHQLNEEEIAFLNKLQNQEENTEDVSIKD